MIPRNPPEPIRYKRDPIWERSKEFEDLLKTLVDDPGSRLPDHLSDDRRIALEAALAVRRWGSGFTRGDYRSAMERAMNETRPLVVAPRSERPTDDLIAAWSQPEARDLWRRIISETPLRFRSAVPGLQCALGVMLVAGGLRTTPHILAAHDLLLNNDALFQLVSDLAQSCDGALRQPPARRGYPQVTRQLPRLAETVVPHVQITLAQIGAAYSRWGIPVGRYIAVDGSLMPAWVPQRSASVNGVVDPELERRLRRRTPEAGFRVHTRTREAGGNGGPPTKTRVVTRAVRGYLLTCLVDIATGLVLSFDLRDASVADEPKVLAETLLPRLFALSPDLDVTALVGDAGFDEDPIHCHLEQHYGIHLVAVRRKHAFQTRTRLFRELDHRSIAAVGADGIAVCRAHRLPLKYVGLEAPRRRVLGLRPGQPASAGAFRTRVLCEKGCGKLSFPTREAWSNLPYYPHTPYGRPDLYAVRRALFSGRNRIESTFSSLQVGYKQCLDGAVRVRVFERVVSEALIALALVTPALLSLSAERSRRGELT